MGKKASRELRNFAGVYLLIKYLSTTNVRKFGTNLDCQITSAPNYATFIGEGRKERREGSAKDILKRIKST